MVSYSDDAAVEFPAGLPAFENCRRFLMVEEADRRPFIFLQSLEQPGLCFITLPVLAIDPAYQLKISAEDLAAIGFERQPAIETDVLCLAVVSIPPGGIPAANLLAPVVIHCVTRRAVQSVREDSVYGCCHPLALPAERTPCS
jgi:flagellar assembly factor FliW